MDPPANRSRRQHPRDRALEGRRLGRVLARPSPWPRPNKKVRFKTTRRPPCACNHSIDLAPRPTTRSQPRGADSTTIPFPPDGILGQLDESGGTRHRRCRTWSAARNAAAAAAVVAVASHRLPAAHASQPLPTAEPADKTTSFVQDSMDYTGTVRHASQSRAYARLYPRGRS